MVQQWTILHLRRARHFARLAASLPYTSMRRRLSRRVSVAAQRLPPFCLGAHGRRPRSNNRQNDNSREMDSIEREGCRELARHRFRRSRELRSQRHHAPVEMHLPRAVDCGISGPRRQNDDRTTEGRAHPAPLDSPGLMIGPTSRALNPLRESPLPNTTINSCSAYNRLVV
jgi:hypothetical protein